MPMHEWSCGHCGGRLQVIRSVDEGGDGPTVEEVKEALKERTPDAERCTNVGGHEWRKNWAGGKITHYKPWGWGKKGSW